MEIGEYPLQNEEIALEALKAAMEAYSNGRGEWPSMTTEERVLHVKKFIDKMNEQKDNVVISLMWEIGKSYDDSVKEFDRTIKYIIDTINEVIELDRNSSKFSIVDNYIAQIRRSPLGVVLSMGPYNYPLNETFTTLIPAIIMGNTTIVKPPRYGVLLYKYLLKAFQESFPPGVVNIIFGRGSDIIPPIMRTGNVNVLAFVGSSRSADLIRQQHPIPHRLRCVLGMDAKNPAIILKDADLDLTINECIEGTLSFNGQRCTAIKMIFVHDSIKNKFLEKFATAVDNIKIGMSWIKGIKITPIPDENRLKYFLEIIEDAKNNGARIINNNGGLNAYNFFYPTILYPVNKDMRIWTEEQFGPIIPITSFNNLEEPILYITNSNYGQQASIFGYNTEDIAYIIDALSNQVSRININSQCQRGPDVFPFTGRKDSAEGTLSVFDALRAFSIRTMVAAKSCDSNKNIIRNIVKNRESKFLSTEFIL
ncbi:NADP-dependent glyceraldehyde-3-phosphate dehydrogenase [Desulfurella sp.]|uniref:NADP-dependent glyceraldehyde-3-phosphate dehydrogenase n=1 Tax=Desulfurella sp. TaxID=1962857 RepID=UPI003D0A3D7C